MHRVVVETRDGLHGSIEWALPIFTLKPMFFI